MNHHRSMDGQGGISETQSASPEGMQRWAELAEAHLPRRWRGHFSAAAEWRFSRVDFAGKSVLDVGAGSGKFSCYAALRGAREVIGLEPEGAGSSTSAAAAFERIRQELGVKQVTLLPLRLQDYDAAGKQFDIVLSMSSINHLDEDACINLLRDPAAVRTYRGFFDRLYELTAPGGTVILSDASRHNFFDTIHLRNPIAPTIEWHKHQTPETWILLLLGSGFHSPKVHWTALGPLRRAQRLLGNRYATYFLQSKFQLEVRK